MRVQLGLGAVLLLALATPVVVPAAASPAAVELAMPTVATAAASASNPYRTTSAPTKKLKGWKQTMHQNFLVAARPGAFQAVYRGSWCGYAEGGKYNNSRVISAHDGVMDLRLNGQLGAGGAFGPTKYCWGHKYGRFSMRARAVGGADNGVATMIWPSSNVWGEGEIDFPEGEFDDRPYLYQHPLGCKDCSHAYVKPAKVQWYPWHVYTAEWTPKAVRLYVDGKRLKTLSHNVPRTNHRWTLQVGPAGPHPQAGVLLVDWVAEWTYKP